MAMLLCETANKIAVTLDLETSDACEAFAMALTSFVAAKAQKGKEALAVRTITEVMATYEQQIAKAAMLQNVETNNPH